MSGAIAIIAIVGSLFCTIGAILGIWKYFIYATKRYHNGKSAIWLKDLVLIIKH